MRKSEQVIYIYASFDHVSGRFFTPLTLARFLPPSQLGPTQSEIFFCDKFQVQFLFSYPPNLEMIATLIVADLIEKFDSSYCA